MKLQDNLTCSIEYNNNVRLNFINGVISVLSGCSFVFCLISILTGNKGTGSSIGEFLNNIADNICSTYLILHGTYEESRSPLGIILVVTVFTAILIIIFLISTINKWWQIPLGTLILITGINLWLNDGNLYLLLGFLLLDGLMLCNMVKMTPRQQLMIGALLVLSLTGSLLAGTIHGERENSIQKTAENLVSQIRYGSGDGYNLPRGNFENLEGLELSKKTILKIKMEKPDSYYLRGYIGSSYNGQGWNEVDKDKVAKENDLFYLLAQDGFNSQNSLSKGAEAAGIQVSHNSITIETVGEKRNYIYTPYELESTNGINIDRIQEGTGLNSSIRGKTKYSLTAIDEAVSKYGQILDRLANKKNKGGTYLRDEYNYRQFAYDNYINLDNEIEEYLKETLGTADSKGDISKAKTKALTLLSKLTYDENVGYNTADGDFVEYFLKTKAGYSVHFATTAALIFRYCGIPARYVEGYLVTPDDVKALTTNETLKVNGTHAHAWMEYYQNGVGWIPFEATTPYIGVMKSGDNISFQGNNQQNKDEKDNQKKNKEKEKKIPLNETNISYLGMTILIVIILLLILLIILAAKKLRKNTGKKDFDNEDDVVALKAMARYIMKNMEKAGMKNQNIPLEEYKCQIEAMAGSDQAATFDSFAQIYNRCVYGNKEVTNEERILAKDFALGIKKQLRKRKRGGENEKK